MARTFPFRPLRSLLIAFIGFATVGCVSSDQYNALKLEKDRMAEQLVAAQRDASTNQAAAKSYKDQLDALSQSGGTTAALLSNLQQANAQLTAERDELNRKYMEALNRPQTASPLPQELNNELQALQQQYQDLVDFDSAKGTVKFKSDVTFNVGDATLTGKAAEVIDRFAKILNSPVASHYELLVAGHTDNQPVHNPATIQKGHKDNWYLSCHRAISVSNELQKNGVNPVRIGVIGYADERPAAPNTSAAGQAQNRRVEVVILPSTVSNAQVAGHTERPAKIVKKNLNKDSGGTAPNLNK